MKTGALVECGFSDDNPHHNPQIDSIEFWRSVGARAKLARRLMLSVEIDVLNAKGVSAKVKRRVSSATKAIDAFRNLADDHVCGLFPDAPDRDVCSLFYGADLTDEDIATALESIRR